MPKTTGLLAVVAVLAGVLCGCSPMGGTGGHHPTVVDPNVLAEAGLRYYWDLDLKLESGQEIERIYLRGETLYCVTSDSLLLAIEAETGVVRWSHQLRTATDTVFAPVHWDEMLLTDKPLTIAQIQDPDTIPPLKPFNAMLVNTSERLYVFDRATGQLYRDIELGFTATTGGATDGESYFVNAIKGLCHAILLGSALERWDMPTGETLKTAPVHYNRRVFVGGVDAMVYCIRPGETYQKVWTQTLDGPVIGGIHVDYRGCFVPSTDHALYAFDTVTGDPLWGSDKFMCQGPLRTPVQVSERTVYVYALGDTFYAINVLTGQQRWTMKDARVVLGVLPKGRVCLLDKDRNLRIVDEVLGEVSTSLPLTGLGRFAANTGTEAIYAATRTGMVYCINPQQSETVGGR